jgi:hypothetical protein
VGALSRKKCLVWYDAQGGQGKSELIKSLFLDKPCGEGVYVAGKVGDVMNAIYLWKEKNPNKHLSWVVLMVPMAAKFHNVSLTAIEGVMDGFICNTKYENGFLLLNPPPKVLILTNHALNWEGLTQDKWIVWETRKPQYETCQLGANCRGCFPMDHGGPTDCSE